jgi:hypothetical protein
MDRRVKPGEDGEFSARIAAKPPSLRATSAIFSQA